MRILTLAWRNVFRHTRRTIITAAAISVGLAAMILMNTMMNGMDKMASEKRSVVAPCDGRMPLETRRQTNDRLPASMRADRPAWLKTVQIYQPEGNARAAVLGRQECSGRVPVL